MMSKFQRFLRVCGLKLIPPYRPIRRPVFSADEALELRIAMQRDLIGDRQPVGNRILIEDQPDYDERQPIDYDAGIPIG
jgi:hypothetical protein